MLIYAVFLVVLIELLIVVAAILITILVTVPVAFAFWNKNAAEEKRKREECHSALSDIVKLLEDYADEKTNEKCKKINEAIRAYNEKCPDHTVDELDC